MFIPEKDDDASKLAATSFNLHGAGTLYFTDEYNQFSQLVGEIEIEVTTRTGEIP